MPSPPTAERRRSSAQRRAPPFITFDGESTWAEGASLLAVYALIATSFWWG
ncbi:MAG: hypothetical protein IPH03_07800 [Tetrasphaera sp.]|nr:hypothetical protein [Tetrasphaera sp.]